MKQIDFTIIGEKILFKYDGVAVMVDFSKFDPADKPVSGVMRAGGITVVVKGE